jgi:hypothetical protein
MGMIWLCRCVVKTTVVNVAKSLILYTRAVVFTPVVSSSKARAVVFTSAAYPEQSFLLR